MKKRPEVLNGRTIKKSCGCGSLYITLNSDPETKQLLEVRLNLGKRGHCLNTQLYQQAILWSLLLQQGAEPKDLIKTIKQHWEGVSCENSQKEADGRLSSCGDLIGRAIIEALEKEEK
jgi:ribonucleoside-diphosphate reductase alpha chain